MSTSLPTPLRALLGLAALAVEEARKIPETLPGSMTAVPVEVISAAMQASMKFQQQVAVLASKGDEVLSYLRGPSEEPPAWATFDDDDDVPADARPVAAFDRVTPESPEDGLEFEPPADLADDFDDRTLPAERDAAGAAAYSEAIGDFDEDGEAVGAGPGTLTVESALEDSTTTVRALADQAPARTPDGKKPPVKVAPAKVPGAKVPGAKAMGAKAMGKKSVDKKAPGKKSAFGPPVISPAAPPGADGPAGPEPAGGPAVPTDT